MGDLGLEKGHQNWNCAAPPWKAKKAKRRTSSVTNLFPLFDHLKYFFVFYLHGQIHEMQIPKNLTDYFGPLIVI